MASDATGMIAATFQPDLGQLTNVLTRQAEAIAEEAVQQARSGVDSTAIWRDARLLWPAFTANQGG